VFAANALSPAKVNQVRITDIENRQMEVIVNEDQLSLAIGKRGQNVRLATKLVGWNIDIRSEEELKREVTEQMGALIASGESVPLSAIEGVTAQQAEALAEHGINDIDSLAGTTVDDLVEFLDLSLDEAEVILNAARAVTAMRDRTVQAGEADVEQHAVSAEADENADVQEVRPSEEMTAEGYDEAVENGVPFTAEPEILARYSADPVAVSESEPFPADEVPLMEAGRDLRPDTITPAPDLTSTEAAAAEHVDELVSDEAEFDQIISEADASSEQTTSAPDATDEAASVGGRDEKQDASPDAAE
jgi:N utilization substance protein A